MDSIDTLLTLYRLKDESRIGWQIRGVVDPESVADHSWATALLCLLYADKAGVNRDHAVAMALVHDLAESVTGDVATRVHDADRAVSTAEKQQRERAAMDGLAPEPHAVRALWDEYEAAETNEARFVRDMNLVDMCLQALCYERDHRYDATTNYPNQGGYRHLDEFFATAAPRITTELGRTLYEQVRRRYE
ncbi:MAG: HD family hydrolase, partial [Spirochaetaceae bacterium]